MLSRACQQTQEIFLFQKLEELGPVVLEELEGDQIKKTKTKNWQKAVGFF